MNVSAPFRVSAKDELAVAFHVRSLRHTFDVLPGRPIVLPHVITRVGTGYDETTGYFRDVPLRRHGNRGQHARRSRLGEHQ